MIEANITHSLNLDFDNISYFIYLTSYLPDRLVLAPRCTNTLHPFR